MTVIRIAAFALMLMSGAGVMAQTTPPTTPTTVGPSDKLQDSPPAAATTGKPNLGAAKSGLTRDQATARLDGQGYKNPTALAQDPSTATWQAHAVKNGNPVVVSIDPLGNISER